ncbi:hypothetical protein ACS0TY_006624 [Phlomoides rotata]
MEEVSEALNAVQAEAALYGDTEDRLLAEIDCTVHLNTVLNQYQINSTQRNRLQWLQDGDHNSWFFHTMNRIRKTSVGLSSLVIDGELTFDPGIISDSVVNFYTELFMAQDQVTATIGNIRSLQGVLSAYGGLSGQIYNPAKSTVYYGTAVTRWVRRFMLRTTCISHGSLPFSYLGVPLFRGAPRTCHLAALADSIISKFNKWKGHSLSLAGRKCMINFVIAASLVHSMMVYYWPRTLLKKIEDAMRNFMWKGDISQRNTSCSVSWARVCSPLDEGGLGVHSIRLANDSFICKLAWEILCNRSTDMALLHGRYISARGKPRNSGRPSSIEPGIRKHLGRLVTGSRWVVGHSSGLSFWNDNWLGYIISERIGIPSSFVHTDIVRDILSIHVSRGSDSRVWGNSISGQLTSRMAYDILRSHNPRVNWSS